MASIQSIPLDKTLQTCANGGIFDNSYDSDYIPNASDPKITLRYRLHVMQYNSSDPRNFEQGNSNGENPYTPPVVGGVNQLNHGIFVEDGTGYMIEDNIFNHAGPPNADYGVLIIDSGDDPNRVKENEFYDIRYAAMAQGLNRDLTNSLIGLEYHCNRFEDAIYALIVYGDGITLTANGGICDNQGRSSDPAGNTFYSNYRDLYNDFDYTIDYWYNGNNPPEIPSTVLGGFIARSTRATPTCSLKSEEPELAFDGDFVPLHLLNKKNSLVGKYEVIEHHIREGEWNKANQLILEIPLSGNVITENQSTEYEDYVSLKNIQYQLFQSERSWPELTSAELTSLIDIADRYRGRAGNQARALLNWFHGGDYYPNYVLPPFLDEPVEEAAIPASNKIEKRDTATAEKSDVSFPSLYVNPNPVIGDTRIIIAGLNHQEVAELSIINVKGETVLRQIVQGNTDLPFSSDALLNGIYFARLITSRSGLVTFKFLIAQK